MTKKLGEIAEIKTLNEKTELSENNILILRNGKKIIKVSKNDIKEYHGKQAYFVITAKSDFIEPIFKSLNSNEFNTWFSAHAKGNALLTISIVDLKEFEIVL